MATHKALVVPQSVEEPVYVTDLEDEDTQTVEEIVIGGTMQESVDYGSFIRHGFLVAVGGWSALDGTAVNTRAISIARAATQQSLSYNLHGPCIFMGCTGHGDYADVPDRVLRAAGVVT